LERILFRFTKGDPVRFVGHLDLMRVFERAMRRSGFPIGYSQGFNPRPRMSFASALTLGATSEWELCQLDLARDVTPAEMEQALTGLRAHLPPGIEVRDIWEIPLEKRNPYIQVRAAAYCLTVVGEDSAVRLKHFLEEGPGLPRGERAGVRIREVIAGLEEALPGLRVARLHRARLWCETDPTATTS
jgi:radical SAM-linked protein